MIYLLNKDFEEIIEKDSETVKISDNKKLRKRKSPGGIKEKRDEGTSKGSVKPTDSGRLRVPRKIQVASDSSRILT